MDVQDSVASCCDDTECASASDVQVMSGLVRSPGLPIETYCRNRSGRPASDKVLPSALDFWYKTFTLIPPPPPARAYSPPPRPRILRAPSPFPFSITVIRRRPMVPPTTPLPAPASPLSVPPVPHSLPPIPIPFSLPLILLMCSAHIVPVELVRVPSSPIHRGRRLVSSPFPLPFLNKCKCALAL